MLGGMPGSPEPQPHPHRSKGGKESRLRLDGSPPTAAAQRSPSVQVLADRT